MSRRVTVPFSHLVLFHSEIGVHRGRKYGFRDVFGYRTLRNLPFLELANRVKDAYEGRNVPDHRGWDHQKENLQWLVDKGKDWILQHNEGHEIKISPFRQDRYSIVSGNHRCLVLYIFGEHEVRAKIKRYER